MRRYSFSYFLGQSLKSLWRNGVMSLASVAVLMSCLIVIGSFMLLLTNVNYNLDKIGILNYIVVFVDVGINSAEEQNPVLDQITDGGGEVPQTGQTDQQDQQDQSGASSGGLSFDYVNISADSAPDTILWNGLSDEEIAELGSNYTVVDFSISFAECESMIATLQEFTDIQMAASAAADIRARLSAVWTVKYDCDEYYLNYFENVKAQFAPLYYRINTLAEIENQIKSMDNVDTVSFTSKTTALEEMKNKYSEYTDLFDRIQYNDNPLNDQFTVTYTNNEEVSSLRYNLEHLDGKVYRVDCREDIATTLQNVKSGVSFVFIWFLIILLVVSMFVIINTIKLAVFSRRQEIMVMRYVGATNWFIVLPFILEGVIIGVISSIAASILQYYAYLYVQTSVTADFAFIEVLGYGGLWGYVTLGFLAVGVITGIIGSTISLNKYLKA